MGQMQRQKRYVREATGRARLKVLFRGAARLTVDQIEQFTTPPSTATEWLEEMAASGITFWYDAAADTIKAQAFLPTAP